MYGKIRHGCARLQSSKNEAIQFTFDRLACGEQVSDLSGKVASEQGVDRVVHDRNGNTCMNSNFKAWMQDGMDARWHGCKGQMCEIAGRKHKTY